MKTIVIATIKSWNILNAEEFASLYAKDVNVHLITTKEELTFDVLQGIKPSYIFFPHWSWIIPEKIFAAFNCVVFHMTDLPFGRGGSPLQNLLIRQIYKTKISAIKVCQDVDAGDVYLKRDLDIAYGSAQEIFMKMSNMIFFEMMPLLLFNDIVPQKQVGEIVLFTRRKSEESDIAQTKLKSIDQWYDFIRMLDGEGYPPAFFTLHGKKIIFKSVRKKGASLVGEFEINEV